MGENKYDEKGIIYRGRTQLLLLQPLNYNDQEVWSPTFMFSFVYEESLGEDFELLRIRTDTNEIYQFILQLGEDTKQRTLWMKNNKSKQKINLGVYFEEKKESQLAIAFIIERNKFRVMANG